MNDLLREFLTETNESLDTVDNQLVKFEQNPNNAEIRPARRRPQALSHPMQHSGAGSAAATRFIRIFTGTEINADV
jgi:hypothetical protein